MHLTKQKQMKRLKREKKKKKNLNILRAHRKYVNSPKRKLEEE